MTTDRILEALVEILKQNKYRKSPSNAWLIVTDGICLDDEMNQKEIRSEVYKLDWGWSEFKQAWDEKFGKRQPSKNVKMVVVRVGDLIGETEKAYQFSSGKFYNKMINGRLFLQPVGIWVPKSQVEFNDLTSELTMPIWLAQQTKYMTIA